MHSERSSAQKKRPLVVVSLVNARVASKGDLLESTVPLYPLCFFFVSVVGSCINLHCLKKCRDTDDLISYEI